MRRPILFAILGLLVLAASASALTKIRPGNLILEAEGGFTPVALPKHHDAEDLPSMAAASSPPFPGELPPVVNTLDY